MSEVKRVKASQSSYRIFQDQKDRLNKVVFDRIQSLSLEDFKKVEEIDVVREALDLGLAGLGYALESQQLKPKGEIL